MSTHTPPPGSKDDFRQIVQLFQRMRTQTLQTGRWADTQEKLRLIRRLAIATMHHSGKPPASVKKAVRSLQEAEQLVNEGVSPQERAALIHSPPRQNPRQWFHFLRRKK